MKHEGAREEKLLSFALREPGGELPEGDPELVSEAQELAAMARRLARASAIERESLLSEGVDPELEARARAALERRMTGSAPAASRRWWGVAAAILVFALAGWLAFRVGARDDPRGPVLSGDEPLELIEPRGAVEDFGTFRWGAVELAGGHFVVRVFAAGDARRAEPLVEITTEETRWTPRAEEPLPDAIRWEVEAIGATGEPLGWAEGSASRSRR